MPHCCGLPARTGASHCGDCHIDGPACVRYRFGALKTVTPPESRHFWPAGHAGVPSSLREVELEAETCGCVARER